MMPMMIMMMNDDDDDDDINGYPTVPLMMPDIFFIFAALNVGANVLLARFQSFPWESRNILLLMMLRKMMIRPSC